MANVEYRLCLNLLAYRFDIWPQPSSNDQKGVRNVVMPVSRHNANHGNIQLIDRSWDFEKNIYPPAPKENISIALAAANHLEANLLRLINLDNALLSPVIRPSLSNFNSDHSWHAN